MQAKWLRDCKSEDETRKRKELLLQSQLILDILSKVCYNSTIECINKENDYSNPNWAYLQADLVGYKRAMNEIIKMCNLKDH